ncbi:50S ribosomal protein L21 [Taibaiella chishuiensis]|nr:50S ribosomal protein L21 [Taibaiella chishuiensis]
MGTKKNNFNFAQNFWSMFAVVTIAGQQFRVQENDELFVHRLEGKAGDSVEFSDVLMTSNGGNITVGGAVKSVVKAEIIDHLKGDKVLIFKKKRRKGYQKLNGHRQALTKIKIQGIA